MIVKDDKTGVILMELCAMPEGLGALKVNGTTRYVSKDLHAPILVLAGKVSVLRDAAAAASGELK